MIPPASGRGAEPLWARLNRVGDRWPGLRGGRQRAVRRVGWHTRRFRVLPDFLIAGAQKAGTTALYHYLRRHPLVLMSTTKEVSYFDANATRDLDWYRSFFPLAAHRRAVERLRGGRSAVGEASPRYMFHPAAARRVHALFPDMRVIFALRNPVDRAYSQYHFLRRRGATAAATFEDAIRRDEATLAAEGDDWDPDLAAFDARRYDSLLRRGLYLEQIERWAAVFPRAQLLVIRTEDLGDRPGDVLREVHRHIGVTPASPGAYPVFNAGRYPPMEPATRERLAAFFEPHNRRLYAWLGRDLGWERPSR